MKVLFGSQRAPYPALMSRESARGRRHGDDDSRGAVCTWLQYNTPGWSAHNQHHESRGLHKHLTQGNADKKQGRDKERDEVGKEDRERERERR